MEVQQTKDKTSVDNNFLHTKLNKKIIITAIFVCSVVMIFNLYIFLKTKYNSNIPAQNSINVSTSEFLPEGDLVKYPPIKEEDVEIYKKQLEDVISKGDSSSCISLSDVRYQLLCENLFKSMNNNSTATGTNINKK